MNTVEKALKFQDAAIEKLNLLDDDYSYIEKKTQSIKLKKQIYIPFDVSKNTHLKGLKLCVFRETKTKTFVVNYWFNNKSKLFVLGKFIPGVFTTKHCSEKLFEIINPH